MHRFYSALLIGTAFLFSGCSPIFSLEGTVSGLDEGTLILNDGNLNSVEITADGSFSFAPAKYQAGDQFQVTIQNQPAGLECRVANYQGTFTNSNVKNVEVVCSTPEETIDLCGAALESMGEFHLQSMQVALGSGLGATGFSSFDSDDDGYPEFMFGSGSGFGSNTKFAIYEFDEDAQTYTSHCESAFVDTSIKKIIPFQNEHYNAASLVALANGQVQVINHRAGKKIATFDSGLVSVSDVAIADVDNDGELEIVLLSGDTIALFNANSFTYENSISYGAKSLAIGAFTDSSKVQIALNTGLLLQVNGVEVEVLWDYTVLGFSNMYLRAGDVDGDGLDEIVAADSWYNIQVFNGDTGGILWQAFPDLDVDALQVVDVNGDGVPEVLYGDGQWGASYALDGLTGEQLWAVPNPEHGVTDILVADLDDDAGLELLWGAGYSSTGPDYLFVHDLTTDTREWQSGESGGPYYAVAFGDIDGDGIDDRIYASFESESGYGDGIVTVIRSSDGQILWQTESNTFGGRAWTGLHDLAVQDVNLDGINDVLVATDLLYDGALYFVNGADGSVMDYVELDSGSPLYSLALADIDNDGIEEILAGGGKEHTGSNGTFVYQLDGIDLEFTYPSLGNDWADIWSLETLDMDADGDLEIIAGKGGVFVIDTVNNALNRTVATNFTAVAVNSSQAFLGDGTGQLYELAINGEATLVGSLCSESVYALEAVSDGQLAFTCGGRLGLYNINEGSVQWQSDVLDPLLGRFDSLAYGVVEGRSALLVGGSTVWYFVK